LSLFHSTAKSGFNSFEKLERVFTASQNGYLYVYVANETNVGASAGSVFFDEMLIVHQKNNTNLQVTQASDYYPFGLQFNTYQAERISNDITPIQKNRYGFQGQELQKDLDLGWSQFKWRMHDPAIGRFGGVDPLADKYVYQSPFNFSENRLIDGRELEGLEYISIHHFANGTDGIKMHYKSTDKAIEKINGTTAGSYNAASYGPLGKGVIHYYYKSDGTINNSKTRWDNQRIDNASKAANHGLYSGPGCITDRYGNYDFNRQPIDWADAIAKKHDMDYATATSSGPKYAGYLEDTRTVQADRDMIFRVGNILQDIEESGELGVAGVETPFRRSSSGEMRAALIGQLYAISALATYKQWKIDNNYTNGDTYEKLRDKFKEYDRKTARIIDKIRP
jgi:RHS repeat-associated protein